jgi:hypothetical protein
MSAFKSKIAEAVVQEDNSTRPAPVKRILSVVTQNLFEVIGGPVRVLRLQGRITTAIQSGANNIKVTHTVPGGSAVDLCGVVDSASAAAGKFLTVEGVKATALLISADVGVAVEGVDAGKATITLAPGTVAFNSAGTKTGVVEWHCVYEPLAPGARVVAA